MSKRRERTPRFEEEYQQLRGRAKHQVTGSVWDRDPIKQYVRRFGWLQVIQDFVERRQKAGVDRPLRYLTIPGSNASDIGLLWRVGLLTQTNDGFPYVAICDETSADEVVANLGRLLGYSNRPFHQAVRWPQGELCSLFPFDVINMDLCGAVITGARNPDTALRQLAAIRWMFRLQRGQGFVLLLTASADEESPRHTLERVLANNLDNEDGFRETYLRQYGALDPKPFLKDYRALVQLVVPKIIGRMARDCGYRMLEHFAARYDRPEHKMFCHSFEFEFLGRTKAAKKYEPFFQEVSVGRVGEEPSSRVQIKAIQAYAGFIPFLLQRNPKDVKAILRSDADLEADLTEESESLIGWWGCEK